MMTFNIFDITGEYATDSDSGQEVYEHIHPQLLESQPVVLDFSGVEVFASPFFNFAIGQLLSDILPEHLNTLLKIENLSPNGDSVLRRVIENAKHYYSDPQHRQAVDTVLEKYATSC